MNKKILALTSAALSVLPFVALADFTPIAPPNIVPGANVYTILNAIFTLVWPVMAAAAIVMFIIAAFLFITSNGDPGKVGAARQSIIWAVIGLAVAIVAFSLPYIIRNTLAGGGF